MGEYIKHNGTVKKIGTCESLYYTSYQKYADALAQDALRSTAGSSVPAEYVKPDSGFRFRFPFPDEDRLVLGDIGKADYARGVAVTIDPRRDGVTAESKDIPPGNSFQLEITQQKLIRSEEDGKPILALVIREPKSGELYSITDEPTGKNIAKAIIRSHVAGEPDQQKRSFYKTIAKRIVEGYHLNISEKQEQKALPQVKPRLLKRGKGL